ncbi:MAG: hypothetical protein ABR923_17985 [Terracidiphilus sp.]|jgi:hypothetical protein
MFENPSDEWQRLTEHYHVMYDGELENLAADFKDLTQTAQEVLRNEMRNRGLPDPAAPPKKPERPRPPIPVAQSQFESDVDPDANAGGHRELDPNGESDGPRDYTWKTLLCECDSEAEAWGLNKALSKAGIDSWILSPGRHGVNSLRIVVAADQLDEAIEVAQQPIPQEFIDEFHEEVPEFVPPKCPQCGAGDPVLESAEPANSWLCEACGKQWTDSVPVPQ